MTISNTVMCVFKFDDKTRELFESVVKPLVETHTGLKYVDGASYYEPLNIKMDLISEMIQDARLVIVDITNKNPNVFIELGIAYSYNKPTIFLCSSDVWEGNEAKDWDNKLPFDIQGRDLLIFSDENELKVKLGRFLSDSLFKTNEITLSWNSQSARNHFKSSSEIEIFGGGEIWSSSSVNSNFIINYQVTIHEFKALDNNPDVRLHIAAEPAGYPRILSIFPWENSEIDPQQYECHIDYFAEGPNYHERLQQISVAPKDKDHMIFDVSVSFCWPNMVFESTSFDDTVDRLCVSLSGLRSRGYPIHLSQYIGFESKNSRVSISDIRVKEIFI